MTITGADRERRFHSLFTRYLADMVAYCGWRAGSAADAQDAVSEVFLVVWRRLDEVPVGDEARLWLYATARRVLANQSRGHRRQALLAARIGSMTGPDGEAREDFHPLIGREDGLDPLEVRLVRAALAELRPLDQEVLLLSEWEGLEPAQIARVLHCPAVTARGRLFRARRRFRALYEQLLMESPALAETMPPRVATPARTAAETRTVAAAPRADAPSRAADQRPAEAGMVTYR